MKRSTLDPGRKTAPSRTMDGTSTSSGEPKLKGHIKERNKACITKMGPWGGIGGQACRIMVEPVCLNSITIRSGKTLLAIAFSYSDKHGKPHHAGPWGANGGQLIGSSFHTILLGPSEHLIQISGTVDMNIEHSTDVITSITFTTNMSVYGPFGTREGLPFRSKLVSNGSIVGFFVRAMCLIDAIGIYVKPEREPMEKQGLITKTGPWGGYNGYLYDVDVSPRRLVSVVVRCSEVIDSIAFTYIDCDGRQHSAGPWGGHGAIRDGGTIHTIVLGRSEYLKEISGTVGPSPHPDIVMSLLFVTNIGSYGPFGGGGGTTFCSPELKNGSIIGFFAHAGQNVDAIGVYVDAIKEKENDGVACANPKLQGDVMDLDKALMMKIGPWGGHSGYLKDIKEAPLCLNSVTIRSGKVVYSLAFSYSDGHGKQHHAGPWGICESFSYGRFDTIQLSSFEFLAEISGTIGFSTQYSANVVTSIKFITNVGSYGPFGAGGGIPFHSPLLGKGSIVGFFAHVGKALDAIGLYVNSERQPTREAVSIMKVGPWGGSSGLCNDVAVLPQRLVSVVVHSGEVVNSLSFTYSDCNGQVHIAGPWGRTVESHDGSSHQILLGDSEFLMEISGTVGPSPDHSDVVSSLLFVTNASSYGPYGQGGGTRFQSPRQRDAVIVGFFANGREFIEAIGVYFSPQEGTNEEEEDVVSGTSDDMASRQRVDIKPASNVLEHMILDESAEPMNLPLALLQHVTEDFAENRQIGRGGFGVVYRGDLQNGSVAVKRLLNSHTIEEEPFNREAISLISVKHKNVVRFLGYCANTENKAMLHAEPGKALKYVFVEIRERLLCFEYINNGSLDKYLTDELRGLEWHTRYQIIRGICDGLVYLHKEKGIVHRDMKPANILLDHRMIPKITDFGISKFLNGATHAVASNRIGSLGYCAPEFINRGLVSIKSDIYSLGVIITELVTGCKDIPDIKNVLRRWRYRWNKSLSYPPSGYQQVTKCIEIVSMCLSDCPKRRPYIWDIVTMLNNIENTKEQINDCDDSPVAPISPYPWELLELDMLELNFPFEINKQIPCSLQLTNVSNDYVAFDIVMTGVLLYDVEPKKGIVPPQSKCNVMVTLQAQQKAPNSTAFKDEFFMRCAAVNEGIMREDITQDMLDKKSAKGVDEVTLKVVISAVGSA